MSLRASRPIPGRAGLNSKGLALPAWRTSFRTLAPPLVALALLLFLSIVVATSVGAVWVEPRRIAALLLAHLGVPVSGVTWTDAEATIVLAVRLPRVLGAVLVGAALAAAGVLYQGLLRNPLADPFVIGASGGAGLGAAAALVFVPGAGLLAGFGVLPVAAFVGALVSVAVVYSIARVGARTPVTTLLLAGFAVSSLTGAGMSFLLVLGDRLQTRVRLLIGWLIGGISITGWEQVLVLAAMVLLGLAAALPLARLLNALALGEEVAAYVGVEVETVKRVVVLVAAWLTATAVTASGLVGFVGLVVPHALRLLVGTDHRLLLPASVLAGASFVVLMDALARLVLAPSELPLGILTACVGGPFFLWLLRGSNRGVE